MIYLSMVGLIALLLLLSIIVFVRADFTRVTAGCKVGKVVDLHISADKVEAKDESER